MRVGSDSDAAARLLGLRRKVRRAGHPIGLGDDAGVAVCAGRGADGVADLLALLGRDGPGEEDTSMKVPGDVSTAKLGRIETTSALALVVVGVDDQAEYEFRVGECAAGRAAQIGAHGPRLDIDVVPGRGDRRS